MFILTKTVTDIPVVLNMNTISRCFASETNVTTCVFTDDKYHSINLDIPFGMFLSKLQEAGLLEKED